MVEPVSHRYLTSTHRAPFILHFVGRFPKQIVAGEALPNGVALKSGASSGGMYDAVSRPFGSG